MKLLSLGVGAFAFVVSGTACRSIFSSDRPVILSVTHVTAPASIPPGTALSIILTVETGGCRRFDHIETQATSSSAVVTVWGRDAGAGRNDVVCPNDITYEQHTVRFEPPFASTFTIMVGRGALPPITVTVEVRPL